MLNIYASFILLSTQNPLSDSQKLRSIMNIETSKWVDSIHELGQLWTILKYSTEAELVSRSKLVTRL